MYYRVAMQRQADQADRPLSWQWQSTPLSSLNSLLRWLQFYQIFPAERLRIFSSPCRETLNEQLVSQNQGHLTTSVPAPQFLQERRITWPAAMGEASTRGTPAEEPRASIPATPSPSRNESGMSPLDKRREALERGAGGDHDLPYQFMLPTGMPQVLVWMRLLARVERGEVQP